MRSLLPIDPHDDGSYGLGESQAHFSLRQELDGGWTIRFGPLSAADVGGALSSFVS